MGSQAGTRSIHVSAIRRRNADDFVRETEKFFASSSSQVVEEPLGRSYLYVPATSERMLEKSLTTTSDVIIYDLEDSVPPSAADKTGARKRLSTFLSDRLADLPAHERIAVRVNSLGTPFFAADISMAISLDCVRTLVLPKIHSAKDLYHVSEAVHAACMGRSRPPVQLVASIESAQAVHKLGQIAQWKAKVEHGGRLSALLFAAEDYCADTGVIRTTSRQELLYTRSYIAVTAKAHKLKAIDMVCVNYKDLDYLRDECEDGRRLGFTGKQAIHPTQVDVIQSTFVPSSKEILRAARILKQMEKAHKSNKGAAGLTLEGGGMEMIDAPMIKQAENVVRAARAAGLEIPDVE
ncbi:citrate lyase beta subunit [Trametes versicolor FP-101664 SS1]|uniref:citrate lyase beta subunit n=1 Tax=Trametes versicolor (strain FP-101664) TaxID=717944 RepID=UPI0004623154|nr:citrate lyase beta subunit [Trametes versicolor FP-101664 SS1]EIW59205.1 citrate lyase beta subunit [Trametes versicolor FP-101664 SS1]